METSQIYVLIAIVVLAIISILMFFVRKDKKQKPLTPLASLAFGFVIAGIVFGDNNLVGYSLMGFGVLLAIIDIIIKLKKRAKK